MEINNFSFFSNSCKSHVKLNILPLYIILFFKSFWFSMHYENRRESNLSYK